MSTSLELPSALQVEITTRCNLKCKMCPLTGKGTPSSLVPGHMLDTTWKKALVAAKVVGKVIISGYGEPLTNPKCLSLLQDLDDLQIWTSISTNGSALTPRIAERLVALKHLFHINVSIDSPDPAIYRELRGGEIEKVLRGLANLMSAIDDPQRVTVSSVLMKENLASLAAFPPILSRLRVRKYVLQGLINLNRDGSAEQLLGLSDASLHLARIKEACDEANVEVSFTLPDRLDLELHDLPTAQRQYFDGADLSGRASRQCTLAWEHPFVDKDGLVFPCCYASAMHAEVLGNLNEMSLAAVWQGKSYQEFRQKLVNGDLTPSCRDCSAVPTGEHPYHRYSAEILFEKSVLQGDRQMCLVVQNTGASAWDRDTLIRIGTAQPRDRPSSYYDPTWINQHRITSFSEEMVSSGQIATFRFRVRPVSTVPSEAFQLVAEGIRWLPNTTFEIRPPRTHIDRLIAFACRSGYTIKSLLRGLSSGKAY